LNLKEYSFRAYNFARAGRLCNSQDGFNDLLKNAYPSYTGNASTLSKLKTVGIGGRAQEQLRDALDAFCRGNEIEPADLPELKDASNSPTKPKLKLQTVPDSLGGRWLFVQYRSVRKDPEHKFPEGGYRAAVLSYGRDNKKKRDISIIGESTGWSGHVQMLDNKLYHFADEHKRTGTVRESAIFITFPPYDGAGSSIQNGVVLGISRGRYEHQAPPVYSSRIMLRQLPDSLCSSASDDKFVQDRFCGYFDKTMRDKQHIDEHARSFLAETFKILDSAGKSPHSKGNHIFVNPIDPRSAE
jgi:hypothetical protein